MMTTKTNKTGRRKLGLLLIYGSRLPECGVVFLAPVYGDRLLKVDKAMRVCAERWPNPERGKKYDRIYADGSLSSCNEERDRVLVLRPTWDGNRYEWDFGKEKFVPMESAKSER